MGKVVKLGGVVMSFFKLHKPLVYNYKPIYYDPKKEAREERRKRMEQANKPAEGNGKGEYEPQILRRGIFREIAEKEKRITRRKARGSNFRVIIILIILLAIAYFLMK